MGESKERLVLLALLAGIALVCSPMAEAKGRKGSHRVGGTNSHGKGSHYVGGAGGAADDVGSRSGHQHAESREAEEPGADTEIARIAAGGSPLPLDPVSHGAVRGSRRVSSAAPVGAADDEPFAGTWSCDGERVRLGSGSLKTRNRHREYRATKAGPGLYLLAEGGNPLATVQVKPSGIVYTGTEAGIDGGRAGVPLSCTRDDY